MCTLFPVKVIEGECEMHMIRELYIRIVKRATNHKPRPKFRIRYVISTAAISLPFVMTFRAGVCQSITLNASQYNAKSVATNINSIKC